MYSKDENTSNPKISFSYSKFYLPTQDYNSSSEFLWFKNVDVEQRTRVKYISLTHSNSFFFT